MVALQESLALKNIVSQFLEKRHTDYRHLTTIDQNSLSHMFSKLPTRHLTRTFLFIFLYCKRIFANFYDFDPFFGLILILLIINKLKTVLKKGAINLKIRDGCCFA